MNTPWTVSRIQKMIDEGVEEDLHLDYKSIDSLGHDGRKKSELSKDVSAFANSDGGIIIYGVTETENKPVKFDNKPSTVDREWIENVINSTIQNKIDNLLIHPLTLDDGNQIFVIEVPKSLRAPHMAKDNRYYKRYNFSSVPMEHYEIEDIRNRKEKALITAKLTTYPENFQGIMQDRIALYATSSTNTVTDTYSIHFIAEEGASLSAKFFLLLDDRFYSRRHGRSFLGKLYQRIVSPSFGHPIWKGHEVNLFERCDTVTIDYEGIWSELQLVSEIYIPGEPEPIINKIQITKNNGSIGYKYSHEE
jgi:hypothetical protein